MTLQHYRTYLIMACWHHNPASPGLATGINGLLYSLGTEHRRVRLGSIVLDMKVCTFGRQRAQKQEREHCFLHKSY